jgi:glycosyltransferase involved in cell wall biosynthesis
MGFNHRMKPSLSLVIITLNEENNIARCIKSVPFASEVIVVDSFSQDQTTQIAHGLGAKITKREFSGYRDQKQFALEKATGDWVLSLDADEALSPLLQDEIQESLQSETFEAYRMPRLSFHLSKWIRHGGWYPDYQTRLFKRNKAHWIGGAVHEHVEIKGTVSDLKHDLLHYVFRDLDDQIETNNEFSSLGAKELLRRGEKFSSIKLIFKPLFKFLECFVWKAGFLDGPEGFIIALGASQSLFLKYAKLWEAQVVTARTVYRELSLKKKMIRVKSPDPRSPSPSEYHPGL